MVVVRSKPRGSDHEDEGPGRVQCVAVSAVGVPSLTPRVNTPQKTERALTSDTGTPFPEAVFSLDHDRQ